MLTGSTKERVSYDQLTPIQWMAGFCRTIEEEKNIEMKEHMLDYVISLLEDADFSGIQKIDRIRRANAQKHTTSNTSASQNGSAKKFGGKLLGQCPVIITTKILVFMIKRIKQKVQSTSTYVQHALQMGGKTFVHPETQCRNKSKKSQSKNE